MRWWIGIVVPGILCLVGLYWAAHDTHAGVLPPGLLLSIAAALLGFLHLKQHFDGPAEGIWPRPWVTTGSGLMLALVLLGLLGVGGLVMASGMPAPSVYYAGIAAFATAVGMSFALLKKYFDHRERRRE